LFQTAGSHRVSFCCGSVTNLPCTVLSSSFMASAIWYPSTACACAQAQNQCCAAVCCAGGRPSGVWLHTGPHRLCVVQHQQVIQRLSHRYSQGSSAEAPCANSYQQGGTVTTSLKHSSSFQISMVLMLLPSCTTCVMHAQVHQWPTGYVSCTVTCAHLVGLIVPRTQLNNQLIF
jgi:hypothetical protein